MTCGNVRATPNSKGIMDLIISIEMGNTIQEGHNGPVNNFGLEIAS